MESAAPEWTQTELNSAGHHGTPRWGDEAISRSPSDPDSRWSAEHDSATSTDAEDVHVSVVDLSALPPDPPGHEESTPHRKEWQVILVSDGHVSLCRKRASLRLSPGDLTLWWGAEPLEAVAVAREGTPRATVLHLPPSLLPLRRSRLRELIGRPLSSTSGVAALLACHMRDLVAHSATVRLAQSAWLKQAAVSLVAALLTGVPEELREESSLRRETLLRIGKTHIELHLDDPSLSPTTIAAALHISVRYLHCVFQQDPMTVNRFVQTRRLERCRRDLADPAKEGLSVDVIRTRWGFQDATVFSRAFKKAYGTTPGEYRRRLRRRPSSAITM